MTTASSSPSPELAELVAELKEACSLKHEDATAERRLRVRSELQAVVTYLQKVQVPLRLLAPIEHLAMALVDAEEGRHHELLEPARMREGASTKRRFESLQWSAGSAIVTVLKDDAKKPLSVALGEVARALGIDPKTLREFRKNVMKGRVPQDVEDNYWQTLQKIRKETEGVSAPISAQILRGILKDIAE